MSFCSEIWSSAELNNNFFFLRSGDDDEYYYVEENNTKEPETEVEQILDEVGDEDLVICDNIERALYLSLKYEFVTPLTSLVVVSPDQVSTTPNSFLDNTSKGALSKRD